VLCVCCVCVCCVCVLCVCVCVCCVCCVCLLCVCVCGCVSVLIFSAKFFWHISRSKKNWARYYHKCILLFVWSTHPLFMPGFNETWILSTYCRKTLRYTISWKSVQGEQSCYMQTDRQTDMTKLIIAFRKFANAPKNCTFCSHCMLPYCTLEQHIDFCPV